MPTIDELLVIALAIEQRVFSGIGHDELAALRQVLDRVILNLQVSR